MREYFTTSINIFSILSLTQKVYTSKNVGRTLPLGSTIENSNVNQTIKQYTREITIPKMLPENMWYWDISRSYSMKVIEHD